MLHLLYILAFTIIAFLAVSNLIRSLITVSMGSQRTVPPSRLGSALKSYHPEMFDDQGHPINEPLLVMRSVSVEDARQQLDAIYNASPGGTLPEKEEES